MKILDYDSHNLIQAFERREEIEKKLQEMKNFIQLKEEELKRKHSELEVLKEEFLVKEEQHLKTITGYKSMVDQALATPQASETEGLKFLRIKVSHLEQEPDEAR